MNYAKTAYFDGVAQADAGASAAGLDDVAEAKRVYADQVDILYRQTSVGTVITLVIAAIATFELWSARRNELVGTWCLLTLVVTAARQGLYLAYFRRRGEVLEKWLRWYAIGAFASGVLWGIAGAVFFPSHADEKQIFLAFLLAGMVAGGVPVFCSVWWVYALYGAGIIVPFTYVLAALGNRLFVEIAFLVPLFYLVNVAIAFRLSRVFADGFRLRHAHERLARDHAQLNTQLQDQIEELVQAQREVEASGRKLALFAERAPIAVFEMDRNGTVLEMNPAAEHIFGYSAIELGGRSMLRMLFPEDEPIASPEWWRRFTESCQPASGIRARCLRRDGIEIMCEFSLTPLVNDSGDLISVIAQCRDITQQMEAERLKKEFTSTLSHELRTPLTSIIGSLQLINTGMLGELEGEIAELTQVAERNGQRLLDLINDILDIEKIESGKLTMTPVPVELDALVAESLVLNKAFADRFGVRLALRGELPPVSVLGDSKRLLQIMTNLVSNAAKFSPEGGQVDIAMERRNAMVRVSVEDRGPGIPHEFRTRIFSRFAQADSTYTRQKGGTGLGLAICKRLIELMGGEVGFSDREGGGTAFYFDLPVSGETSIAPAPKEARADG
jgi:PAS domain S-box-containing protein